MPVRSTRAGETTTATPGRRAIATPCLFAAAIAALVAAGCGAGSHASAATNTAAPSCLPSTVDHSSKLAGVPVDVTPAPGTDTASPQTQISFVGVPAGQIHDVSVAGARSGSHSGRLEPYSQGNGASFLPAKPFAAGESVAVRATIGTAKGGRQVSFAFQVETPYSTAAVGSFANPPAAPGDYQTFDTLPGVQAPVLTVTTPDHDPAAGDILTSNGPGAGQYGAFIYSPQGQLVWLHQPPGGLVDDDLSVQTYQGARDLTFWQGKVLSWGFGQGEDIVMNSRYQTVATVSGGNGLQADLHDFQIAANGVAYVTAYNPMSCNLTSAGGPHNGVILDTAVEEIDMRTGLVRWEWHSLDHIAVSESETSPPKTGFWDWFHLNSIDPQPDGNIFISARNTWAGYQIQGGSGTILWRLGGLKSSFKGGPGTETAWQHDGRILPNGDVTFFDDGSDPTEPFDTQSRGVEIALDFKTHQARLVSALEHANPPLQAASQGNVQTLANGNRVLGWGGVPVISEYAKNGSLLFDAHMSFDLIFYRAFRFAWSASPQSPPAAAANLNNTALETIVHMSWNGATDVRGWRVLAGPTAGSLRPRATVASTGLETSTILPGTYGSAHLKNNGYVAVAALDGAGHVLGTSHAVAVGSYAALLPAGGRAG